MLDPCLLFPAPALQNVSSKTTYALVYGYDFPDWLKRLARRWSYAAGVRLVSVGYSNDFAHEQRIDEGPLEFARLVSGASAIITNFFHGCVFSLMFGKPWVTAPSDYRSIKIPDLAAKLGTEHRLVDSGTQDNHFAELMDTPLQPRVEARVIELRASSGAYLDAALA